MKQTVQGLKTRLLKKSKLNKQQQCMSEKGGFCQGQEQKG